LCTQRRATQALPLPIWQRCRWLRAAEAPANRVFSRAGTDTDCGRDAKQRRRCRYHSGYWKVAHIREAGMRLAGLPVTAETTNDQAAPSIYLDADACPVKEQVCRVAARYDVPVSVVANSPMRVPHQAGLTARLIVVSDSLDAADDWIVERARPRDLVLTADIPLAARVIANGVRCLDFRGGEFNPSRIGDALASRDLNAYLRSMGMITGGPATISQKDRGRFASLLDNAVSKMVREAASD